MFLRSLAGVDGIIGLGNPHTHYPPYCSKHNPIAHRLFHHITRGCQAIYEKCRARAGIKSQCRRFGSYL
ncbi:ISAzo13-like element transposase-related protein [Methylomonas albis]|uniref:Uncharacterized protein n=1 Tax=Methylomonas albis TaxID=1854563 RepID=A0ABR9D0T2_9GAMM|nr:hypothetical protein [Methylomonas albis]